LLRNLLLLLLLLVLMLLQLMLVLLLLQLMLMCTRDALLHHSLEAGEIAVLFITLRTGGEILIITHRAEPIRGVPTGTSGLWHGDARMDGCIKSPNRGLR